MADMPLIVERQSNQLVVAGATIGKDMDQGVWSAVKLDSGRLLLTSHESGSTPDKSEGFARCSIDVLHDMLIGLNRRHWSGAILVDTGFGQKRFFFNKGNLCFAGSTLIDDRLGEIMYRESMITLDQLTHSAVQVDRTKKFGQVLLKDKIFSNTDLWNALKNQVREIFCSVFLVSDVYVEIFQGTPPTEITFDEGTEHLIESSYSAGLQFRAFFQRLRKDTKIQVISSERIDSLAPGTFLDDMIQLARKQSSVKDLLEVSKLTDINTLWVLHRMSCLGLIEFVDLGSTKVEFSGAKFENIKRKIDSFTFLSDMVLKAFSSSNISFPVAELQKFARSLADGNLVAIYIDDSGQLGKDCTRNILSQCQGAQARVQYFEVRLDSITRYVLSVAADTLPFDVVKKIRAQYAEISS